MTDLRLLTLKHGRVMGPIILLIVLLGLTRILCDSLIVMQFYSFGVMLLSIALSVYGLDSIIRSMGLCADRLLLLSPLSRFQITGRNATVVGLYLLIGHMASMLGIIRVIPVGGADVLAGFIGYVVSVVSGLGSMVLIAYLLKGVRTKAPYVLLAWGGYVLLGAGSVVGCVAMVKASAPFASWIVGIASDTAAVNLYAASIPVTVSGVGGSVGLFVSCIGANALLGICVWLVSGLLARRSTNFVQLR